MPSKTTAVHFYRSPKIKKPPKKKNSNKLKNVPKVVFRIIPELYPARVTRGVRKMLEQVKDFIILEIYRCMPLLGDETEQAPDWTVHIVRYDIVFTD